VLPTQVDPKVLSELPEDIRAKLTKHVRPSIESIVDNDLLGRSAKAQTRAESPAVALPNLSQLDPSILDALPEDVRAEILGFYKSPRKKHDQSVLPQSPRKNRVIPPPKQIVRRKRGGGLLASRFRAVQADNSTLTQSNFVARPRHDERAVTINSADNTPEPDAPDPDFLAALPEDIRREILDSSAQAGLIFRSTSSKHSEPRRRSPTRRRMERRRRRAQSCWTRCLHRRLLLLPSCLLCRI
jgi:DNA repair protein REV1